MQRLIDDVIAGLQHEYGDRRVVERVENRGRVGIIIKNPDSKIAPVIWVKDFWAAIGVDNIVKGIVYAIDNCPISKNNTDEFLESLKSKEWLLRHVRPVMIGYERNVEELKRCPHLRLLDMAITYRALTSDFSKLGSLEINNDYLDALEVNLEELERAAAENLSKMDYTFKPLDIFPDAPRVVTTPNYFLGASLLLRRDVLQALCKLLGEHIYIVVSSVHEFIAFPDDMNPEIIEKILRDVNRDPDAQLEADVVSDTVYEYTMGAEKIKIAGGD